MDSQKVWAPDQTHGYILGKIIDIGTDLVTVQPFDQRFKSIQTTYDCLFQAENDDNKDYDDNCALMYLNEATLLHNIRLRYQKDCIYTYVANILIAVNPYYEIKNLYSTQTLKNYQGKSLGTLPPHVFAIADKAFRDMRALKQSQSIIVSGESGAGKTESTKYVLKYLCQSWANQSGSIEQLILDANPILEAFGNAKTVRNNNSSRFGKFIEIHFNSKFSVVGGFISHYLLEKSRICGQSSGERNYHIFYQLCAGLPDNWWTKLKLSTPDQFHYLNKGCTQFFTSKEFDKKLNSNRKSREHLNKGSLNDLIVDDVADFAATDKALGHFGVNQDERFNIYKIVAAVLHIGNISFEESLDDSTHAGGCRLTKESYATINCVSQLIGIDSQELQQSLLSRVMQTSKGGHKGTVYMVPLKVHEAQNARDALAKAIYSKLFDFIVTKIINKSIPFCQSSHYIGVLDIAGFEYFKTNSFEQFCINYCNEKLQQFFNERILKEEQMIYEREGLGLSRIEFIDNQDCIDLIEAKSTGIFDLLDEESKLPKPLATHFTQMVHQTHSDHFRLSIPRKSKLKDHRELRDDEGFLIRHFAGAVCYQTQHFIEKNNDALHASLESLMQDAQNNLLKSLFVNYNSNNDSINNNKSSGKLTFVSVSSKFKSQLFDLMTKLSSTGTHFIRCVKPNLSMISHQFDGALILSQLRCSGMTSVLQLMQQGFPSRASFAQLYSMYEGYLPAELRRLDPRTFCKALFKALGLNENEFRFGCTKVFFKPGKFAEFDQIMKSDPENLSHLIKKVQKWLLTSRWKKSQWCCLSVIKLKNKILYRRSQIIVLQKNIRMINARNKYRPKYKALITMKKQRQHILSLKELTKQLKSNEDKQKYENLIKSVENKMSDFVKMIKTNDKITKNEIEKQLSDFDKFINDNVYVLRNKISEEERLAKIQAQMEAERLRKEQEEKRRREEEEIKRRKAELEERRLKELVAIQEKQEKEKSQIEEEIKKKRELEAERQRLEQEKRDYELATVLAQESQSSVNDNPWNSQSPTLLPRSSSLQQQQHQQQQQNKKYDLSNWKYSDLRDTINTSCDLELLEACREEFHRRLKVYHAWKTRANQRNQINGNEERAPSSIMQYQQCYNGINHNFNTTNNNNNNNNSNSNNEQRYFRIPFVKPTGRSNQKGLWFAHFDGQWIARQMEIHPEKQPFLLVAGRDDMQMCELSLDETRLTSKRGAEILAEEFEFEWKRHGGQPYIRPADRKK